MRTLDVDATETTTRATAHAAPTSVANIVGNKGRLHSGLCLALAAAIAGVPTLLHAEEAARPAMSRLLARSAAVEWVFGHCDNKGLDAGYLLAAQATLAQAPSALSAMARGWVKDEASKRYKTEQEACADMRGAVPAPPKSP